MQNKLKVFERKLLSKMLLQSSQLLYDMQRWFAWTQFFFFDKKRNFIVDDE